MKTGIAMWHYPHRTTIENIEYFAGQGIKTLGLNQSQLTDACEAGKGAELAQVIKKNDLTITLHGALTYSHSEEDVTDYKKRMDTVGEWQKKYGLLSVVSFDVFECTRDKTVCPCPDPVLQDREAEQQSDLQWHHLLLQTA